MSVIKKTRLQVIEELETKLKKLKAEEAEQKLDRSSPGMEQLLSAIDVVTKENDCKVFDVLKSISRIKKTGAKIEPPTKRKKEPKSPSPAQSEQPDTAPKRQESTSKSKQGPKK